MNDSCPEHEELRLFLVAADLNERCLLIGIDEIGANIGESGLAISEARVTDLVDSARVDPSDERPSL
jgi:hypothetical protein